MSVGARPKVSLLVRSIASLTRRRRKWGEYRVPAAEAYLLELENDPHTFAAAVTFEKLRFECDLLDLESADQPSLLALHRRIFALAESDEKWRHVVKDRMLSAPIVKLFFGIVAQADADGASRIHIRAKSSENFSVVFSVQGKLIEAMSIPMSLHAPLVAVCRSVDALGFAVVRSYMENPRPDALSVETSVHETTIHLSSQ